MVGLVRIAGVASAILSLVAGSTMAHAASRGCDAINATQLPLTADAKRIGSLADQAQSTVCLAVGFNGGCFGRAGQQTLATDNPQTSAAYDLTAGETIVFAITKSGDRDVARIVVLEPGTLEVTPLSNAMLSIGHSGTYRFELQSSGASGHLATVRLTCLPASS
jgi:hypothetical protein